MIITIYNSNIVINIVIAMDTYAFDMLIDNKTQEVIAIYEEKIKGKSKTQKMTTDPSVLDYNSKKLIYKINAAYDKKLKSSKSYKKKCNEELSNIAPH